MNIQEFCAKIDNIIDTHKKTAEVLKTMINKMRDIDEKTDKFIIKSIKNEMNTIIQNATNKTVKDAYDASHTDVDIEKKLLTIAQEYGFHMRAFSEWECFQKADLHNIEIISNLLSTNSDDIQNIKYALKAFMILYENP